MRVDPTRAQPRQEVPPLARAKSTARAEARRRNRAAMQPNELSGGVATPNVAGGAGAADASSAGADRRAAAPPRRGFFNFRMPDIRADLPGLPHELRTNRWIWFAAALLLLGLGLYYAAPSVPTDLLPVFGIVITLIIIPPALPVLLGSFFARRAPYLVGGVLGLLNGVIYAIIIASATPLPGSVNAARTGLDPLGAFINAAIFGVLFGGIAGWYRKFLNENNARTRAARESRAADQRRKAKQDARGAKAAR
jgi:hypothetical protein